MIKKKNSARIVVLPDRSTGELQAFVRMQNGERVEYLDKPLNLHVIVSKESTNVVWGTRGWTLTTMLFAATIWFARDIALELYHSVVFDQIVLLTRSAFAI